MENALHLRIKQRLDEMKLSEEAASLKMGADRSYLRKLFERPESSPRGKTLMKIANALDVSEAWLLTGATDQPAAAAVESLSPQPSASNGPAIAPPPPARRDMPLDVPVMGTAAGSHLGGAFQFEGGIIDFVRRPPALMTAKDTYALFVEGSSMEPQYFPGDLIYVHPHRPARSGDIVVVQCKNGEHSAEEATLGILRRTTEKAVVIAKHNPRAEVEIARTTVTAIHRVFTTNELFGL